MRLTQPGDLVLLISQRDRKNFVRVLTAGETLHTHNGYLLHDDMIGQPYGLLVRTHLGAPYYLFPPTTDELVRYINRQSQIVFPKDSGYIMMKLGVRPGARVVEAGTGSGGLCVALATFVGEEGHVYSYDLRDDLQSIGRRNIAQIGLSSRVTFQLRDAADGFDEQDVDAVFLDMQKPWLVLDQARAALIGGGMLGSLVPTINQLGKLLSRLERHPGFDFIEAEELLLRPYKTIPQRIRPDDRIVGHTGFLVFARAIRPPEAQPTAATPDEAGAEPGP